MKSLSSQNFSICNVFEKPVLKVKSQDLTFVLPGMCPNHCVLNQWMLQISWQGNGFKKLFPEDKHIPANISNYYSATQHNG